MFRNTGVRHTPYCPKNVALVNQYLNPVKDTNVYLCDNGAGHPIYNEAGDIHLSLPLNSYPPQHQVAKTLRGAPQNPSKCSDLYKCVQNYTDD